MSGAWPWLSVLVPVYNVEPYLRTCVESVLAEADGGVELLLLDDRSSDGSANVLADLQRLHGQRLRCLRHDANLGLSEARNSLLQAAQGRHVWFLDSDDWLAPGALPRLRELLQGDAPPDLVFCDYRIVRSRARLKFRLRGEHHRCSLKGPARQRLPGGAALLEAALASGSLFAWSHVSRRSLWHADGQVLRFPPGRSFEDMATTPRLLLRAASAWYEPVPWVQYRRRDDSLSALMSAAKVRDLSHSLTGLRRAVLERWPDAAWSTRFAVAHQAARNLAAVQRHARHLPERDALMREARLHFADNAGGDLARVFGEYLRRGWWWRAWRLRILL